MINDRGQSLCVDSVYGVSRGLVSLPFWRWNIVHLYSSKCAGSFRILGGWCRCNCNIFLPGLTFSCLVNYQILALFEKKNSFWLNKVD